MNQIILDMCSKNVLVFRRISFVENKNRSMQKAGGKANAKYAPVAIADTAKIFEKRH